MPLCVAGMHRSGTSLIARILHDAGMHLGGKDDIMPPGAGNSEGHWENVRFVKLNDAILELAGGEWYRPPPLDDGWQFDPKFDPLLERAAALLSDFKGREPWGWKDPRNSLTLPFWQRLVPNLKVIVCLRNPLEVTQSLFVRDNFPESHSVYLWAEYSSRAVAAAPVERRLVTHYESCFLDFHAEAERLLRFAELPVAASGLADAGAIAVDGLRHNRHSLRDLFDGRLSNDYQRLYTDLCAEAGPVFKRSYQLELLAAADRSTPSDGDAGDRETRLLGRIAAWVNESERQIKIKNEELERLHARLCEYHEVVLNERRRGDAFEERLAAKRHVWADWAATWYHRIRRVRRVERP